MLRATSIVRKPAVKADRVADTVTLDHQGRGQPKLALKGERGLDFVLDLDRSTSLNDGDAVKLEDGRLVQVKAAPQPLLEVRAENPLRLLKVAYHLGSRHAATEFATEALYIEDDPALAELVRGHGCTATAVTRPFQPERATSEHDCGHDHGPHGHAHSHHGRHHHDHDHRRHDHAHDRDGHDHAHDHEGHHRHEAHDHHRAHDHDGHRRHEAHDHGHAHDHDGHRRHEAHDHGAHDPRRHEHGD